MICSANQLTGFDMMATLAFNELILGNSFLFKSDFYFRSMAFFFLTVRSDHRGCFIKKDVLKNLVKFTGLRPATLFKNEPQTQEFLCEFC